MQCPICNDTVLPFLQLYDDRYGLEGLFDLFQCQSCQNVFVNTEFNDEQVAELYSAHYPRRTMTEISVPKIWFLLSWLNGNPSPSQYVLPSTKVLDIGCGTGENLLHLKNLGCDAIGIDADKNVLPLAQKYGLDIRIGVFDKNLFEKESFDYILMDQVIEHIKDPVTLLKDAETLLKPSGKIVLSTPWIWRLGRRIWGRKWAHWHIPYHVTFVSARSLEIMAQKAGFVLERVVQKTSSSWIYAQWRHLLFYPRQGEPSYFWGRHLGTMQASPWKKTGWLLLKVWHQLRFDHLITRLLDQLGQGDNIVVVLSHDANK